MKAWLRRTVLVAQILYPALEGAPVLLLVAASAVIYAWFHAVHTQVAHVFLMALIGLFVVLRGLGR